MAVVIHMSSFTGGMIVGALIFAVFIAVGMLLSR